MKPGNILSPYLFVIGLLGVAWLSLSSAYAQITTVPPGLNGGDQYRLVFVTKDGNFTAISSTAAHYDAWVTEQANQSAELVELGTTWRVIGSTPSVSVKIHTGTDDSPTGLNGVPIYRLDGVRIADNYDDFWQGSIQAQLNVAQDGAVQNTCSSVWTGGMGAGSGHELGSPDLKVYHGYQSETGSSGWFDFDYETHALDQKCLYAISDILVMPQVSAFKADGLVESTYGGFKFPDGSIQTTAQIMGPPGLQGDPGTNGIDGTNGTDGTNGIDGTNGTDGTNGIDGTNGTDGAEGPQGPPGPVSIPTNCPHGDAIVWDISFAAWVCESDVSPPPTVFITSTLHTGDLKSAGSGLPGCGGGECTDGLAGGDAICNDLASQAGLPGNWVAWLSTATVNAKDRILDTEYRRVDGVVVATNLTDLTDASLSAPISINELGNGPVPAPPYAWTNTLASGIWREFDPANYCSEWASTSASGTAGHSGFTDGNWSAGLFQSCAIPTRLYCFAGPIL